MLKIENYSTKVIKLQFTNSSNYSFTKKVITINAKCYQEVGITFCPKIVSELNEVLAIVSGEFSFPFKVLGKGTFNKLQKRNVSQSRLDFTLPAINNLNTKG